MQSYILIRKLNLFKFRREFTVLDGVSQNVLFKVTEENPTLIQRILRIINISEVSFRFNLFSKDEKKLISFYKGFTWFTSRTVFFNSHNQTIGILRRDLFGVEGEKYLLQIEEGKLNLKLRFESGTFNYKFVNERDLVVAKVQRESDEIKEIRKEIVKKNNPIQSFYYITISDSLESEFTKHLLFISVVSIVDLVFMDRADESESYS
jgi:hypothetical protein